MTRRTVRPGRRALATLAFLAGPLALAQLTASGCATDETSRPPEEDAQALPQVDAAPEASSVDAADASPPCLEGSGAWCAVKVPATGVDLTSVWGASASDVWAVGYPDAVLRWNGSAWAVVRKPDERYRIRSVWGSGASDVWFVSTHLYTLHYDGRNADGGPVLAYLPPADPLNISAEPDDLLGGVWGSRPGEVWAAGGGTVYRTNAYVLDAGPGWQPVPSDVPSYSDTRFLAGFAESPATSYAVGESGAVVRLDTRDGGTTTVVAQRSGSVRSLNGVWAAPGKVVLACGASGTLLRAASADGGVLVFDEVPTGTERDLNGIWGSSADDVWVVGAQGTILHWDGKAWTRDASVTTTSDLYGVWGTGPDDVWAVGRDVILHRTRASR